MNYFKHKKGLPNQTIEPFRDYPASLSKYGHQQRSVGRKTVTVVDDLLLRRA